MFTRDWSLETLSRLPLWYWPVFLWEVSTFERYYRAYRAANPVGRLGVGVTPKGRIFIKLQAAGDRPDPNDWTRHAPRAPWQKLGLDVLAAAFASVFGVRREAARADDISSDFAFAMRAVRLDPG